MVVTFPNSLKSRKFWLSLISAFIVFANKFWEMGLDEGEILTIVGSLLSFVLVEGIADVRGRWPQ